MSQAFDRVFVIMFNATWLATIEKNFGLGTLGRNDQVAATFAFLWS